jgi:outer membrane protein assembly factor BamE
MRFINYSLTQKDIIMPNYFCNLTKALLSAMVCIYLSTMLCGCDALAYRPTVKQGNVITEKQVHSLRKGMSSKAVIAKLGNPVYNNLFTKNQMIYVYTIKPGHRRLKRSQLIINFRHNRLTSYNFQPLH